ncbi:DNA replication and repair protein RecF [Candidatus Microgenomates bacterium]|jgi:DNA replication and repair protein RecF|nr:MAG: DNA replication and repair protein RecF [Candidatus Microgenomates bacterium]
MILESITLKNFRNHKNAFFEFSLQTTLVAGENAAGKTNLLEAIYLVASGRSLRVKGVESEMIGYGEEIANIKAKTEKCNLEIILTKGELFGKRVSKKKYLVNQIARRTVDFLGNIRAVYFGPENLELITDSPSLRRKYLDAVLSQVDSEYARASLSYEKGLKTRNKILEKIRELQETDSSAESVGASRKKLYFWDQLLIKNGNIITLKREEFIEFLNKNSELLNCGEEKRQSPRFSLFYDRSTISEERLKQYSQQEIASATTLVGPHRDDFIIKSVGSFGLENRERDLSVYGSRGEQRLAILWLKLGELGFIEEKTGEKPILLLDDIFSELDLEHRKLVFDVTFEKQTIITTADLGMVETSWLKDVKLISL